MTVLDFLPGHALPALSQNAKEKQLYRARRRDGEVAAMTVESGVWQWRLRGGEGADAYGSGGWSALQEWLKG